MWCSWSIPSTTKRELSNGNLGFTLHASFGFLLKYFCALNHNRLFSCSAVESENETAAAQADAGDAPWGPDITVSKASIVTWYEARAVSWAVWAWFPFSTSGVCRKVYRNVSSIDIVSFLKVMGQIFRGMFAEYIGKAFWQRTWEKQSELHILLFPYCSVPRICHPEQQAWHGMVLTFPNLACLEPFLLDILLVNRICDAIHLTWQKLFHDKMNKSFRTQWFVRVKLYLPEE